MYKLSEDLNSWSSTLSLSYLAFTFKSMFLSSVFCIPNFKSALLASRFSIFLDWCWFTRYSFFRVSFFFSNSIWKFLDLEISSWFYQVCMNEFVERWIHESQNLYKAFNLEIIFNKFSCMKYKCLESIISFLPNW